MYSCRRGFTTALSTVFIFSITDMSFAYSYGPLLNDARELVGTR
jgi:hypothetical protein